ncbi:methyltransferase domain-containing protein [uncultured Thiodictyon sp.]|jgi:SAM-dependent methyltransferase|uniref:methyltransferase domain-containing protein n=1 Tax=uncultured Thiodictyon sp. TaxID=1846217 RepID=UPI0025FFBEF1|nr:methyltransferase domain-containing protein [uncultured Thiodictyon sp.]
MSAPPERQVKRPWHRYLACPICKSPLNWGAAGCRCTNAACTAEFPLVRGVPVVINEGRSLFCIADFTAGHATTFVESGPGAGSRRPSRLRRFIPSNTRSVRYGGTRRFIARFQGTDQLVLVIGAGDQVFTGEGSANLICTDVHLGAGVELIADCHDLPLLDGTMDAVVAVSVLEHVADPQRCAAEIVRVLKPGGLLLAETPFMQQVHMGRFDFTRFTDLGHRRLWNHFREIESGLSCGPGTALAWAWQYFLLSFSQRPTTRKYLRALARLTAFPLPWFDLYLKDKAGAYDAASSFFFIGEKLTEPVSDRDIIAGYRGLDSPR